MSMTDNAANVAACNQSLNMLGAENIAVGSVTDQNHIYCTSVFDDARDEILAAGQWNFAMKGDYALETTSPKFGYNQAFTKPTDSVKIWIIAQMQDSDFKVEGSLIKTDLGEVPAGWVTATDYVAGQYLSSNDSGTDLTYIVDTGFTSSTETTDLSSFCTAQASNVAGLEVEYVFQRTDVDAWPVAPRQSLIINLARMLAPAIKQNEKAAVTFQQMLYGGPRITGYINIALSQDAQEGGVVRFATNTLLRSRHSRRVLR